MFMIRSDLEKVVNMAVLRELLASSKFYLRYAGVYDGKEIPKGGELSSRIVRRNLGKELYYGTALRKL